METVSMEPDADGGELLAANVASYCVSCGALAKQFGGLKMSNGSEASDPLSHICVANIASGLRGLRFSAKKKKPFQGSDVRSEDTVRGGR